MDRPRHSRFGERREDRKIGYIEASFMPSPTPVSEYGKLHLNFTIRYMNEAIFSSDNVEGVTRRIWFASVSDGVLSENL